MLSSAKPRADMSDHWAKWLSGQNVRSWELYYIKVRACTPWNHPLPILLREGSYLPTQVPCFMGKGRVGQELRRSDKGKVIKKYNYKTQRSERNQNIRATGLTKKKIVGQETLWQGQGDNSLLSFPFPTQRIPIRCFCHLPMISWEEKNNPRGDSNKVSATPHFASYDILFFPKKNISSVT